MNKKVGIALVSAAVVGLLAAGPASADHHNKKKAAHGAKAEKECKGHKGHDEHKDGGEHHE